MLTTATIHSVAPVRETEPSAVIRLAPPVAAPAPKDLACSWAVDPATGKVRAQWGLRTHG
jgi:hypothetical protein